MKFRYLVSLTTLLIPVTSWATCPGDICGGGNQSGSPSANAEIIDYGESIDIQNNTDIKNHNHNTVGVITNVKGGNSKATVGNIDGGDSSIGDITISNNREASKIPVNSAFAPAVMTACANSAAGTNKSFSLSFGRNDPVCYLATELDHRYRQYSNCSSQLEGMSNVLQDVISDKTILQIRLKASTGEEKKLVHKAYQYTVDHANAIRNDMARNNQSCEAHGNRIAYLEHQYAILVDNKIGRNNFMKWLRSNASEGELAVDSVVRMITGGRL